MSVLVTSYNRARYIGASIESVLAQTLGDFELLVSDDRSSDDSVAIAQEYAAQDARVRVVVNERNLGDYGNRNRVAGLARGVYLKFHDSDDLMYPHCLATMVALLSAEPRAGFALSAGWYWPGGPCPMLLTPRMAYQREFLGQGLFMCGPAAALFRTKVFERLGGFPDRGVGSDYLFWLAACAVEHVLLAPADLFWYRVHSGQELTKPQAAREYALIPGEAWRALGAAECPLQPEERERAKRNLACTIVKLCLRDVRAGHAAVARARLRHAGLRARDWLRYLRPPKRHGHAGTPLDQHGEFLVPSWMRAVPDAEPAPRRP